MNPERLKLCRALVLSGPRVIRDGKDHSEKVNRCIVLGLDDKPKCVGYYSILLCYDEETDTFNTGTSMQTQATQVDEVALFDRLEAIK
jgi:hypothetical protein